LKNVDKSIVEEALKEMNVGLDTSQTRVYGRYENRSSECDGLLMLNG
jgi:hypothetical protein